MKKKVLGFWAIWALFGFLFHEAWRDEAQAWLVVKSASSLKELLFLSSLEATPPVYYFILWPFAKLLPSGFAWLPWVLSVTGSFLAVKKLFELNFLRSPLLTLFLCFGFLLGFEFATLARLYGWGLYFLLLGLENEKKERGWQAGFYFSLGALVQGPFGLAAFGLYFSRFLEKPRVFFQRRWRDLLVLSVALVFFAWHNNLAADLREWTGHFGFPKRLSLLGGTLNTLFIHLPVNMGYLGFFICALSFVFLPKNTRLPFLALVTGHAIVFSFVYGHFAGIAQPRHGAALFLMYLYFWRQDPALISLSEVSNLKSLKGHLFARLLLKNKRTLASELFVTSLLVISLLSGLVYKGWDLFFPFSDSKTLSQLVRSHTPKGESFKLFTWDEQETYALQAYLNAPVYVGSKHQEITTPGFTRERNQAKREASEQSVDWNSISKACPARTSCFVAVRSRWGDAPDARFKLLHRASRTLSDESLNLFQLSL